MIVPEGAIWQELRGRALSTISSSCRMLPRDPAGLGSWMRSGAFSVVSVSPSAVVLEAASVDVAAALLGEAAFLLDHAQEHSVQLRHQLAAGRWYSSAWLSVSVYYWAFYAALALTRLMGRVPWFLGREEAKFLSGLSAVGSTKVGVGPRVFVCGAATSLSMREVRIERAGSTRLHDNVWRLWFATLRQVVGPLLDEKSASSELRAYVPQILAANRLGDSWPSDYRNLVNYVPGLAYGAVHGNTPTSAFAAIQIDPPLTPDEAIARLEADASAITERRPIREQLVSCTRLLVSNTFVLDALANSLFEDIVDRRSIDKRWLRARARFARREFRMFRSYEWPIVYS